MVTSRQKVAGNTEAASASPSSHPVTEVRGGAASNPTSWQQDQTSEEISLPSDYVSVDGMRITDQSVAEPVRYMIRNSYFLYHFDSNLLFDLRI